MQRPPSDDQGETLCAAPSWSLDWGVQCRGTLVLCGRVWPKQRDGIRNLELLLDDAVQPVPCTLIPGDGNPLQAVHNELAFMALAEVAEPRTRVQGTLSCGTLRPGERLVLDTQGCEIDTLQAGRGGRFTTGVGRRSLHRTLTLLRSGGLVALRGKLARYATALRPGLVSQRRLGEALAAADTGLRLFVSHGLGGGAERYCDERVAAARAAGVTAVRIQADPLRDSYRVSIIDAQRSLQGRTRSLGWLAALLPGSCQAVELHTAAHFPDPGSLFVLLLRLQPAVPLQIYLHDYFLICPSHFLLADTGRFCGIPSLADCERCLPGNASTVVTDYRAIRPRAWRRIGGLLLHTASRVTAFSHASRDLLLRAYPALDPVELEPPAATAAGAKAAKAGLHASRQSGKSGESMHIGIIGEIGWHKGSGIVAELAGFLHREARPARITVIGTIEARCDNIVLRQTGPYDAAELPELLAQAGINIILFPSIVPETYSFTIREATATKLPVACFDLGAQAEHLADYPAGAILEATDPATICRRLGALFEQHYGSAPAASHGGAGA